MSKNFWKIPSNLVIGNWQTIKLKDDGSGFEAVTPADVSWPASSTNNSLPTFDWTSWKIIKDSWVSVSTTLGNDDTTVPTSKAVADAVWQLWWWDMLKSTYDTDNNWIVNQADAITNQWDLATLDSVWTSEIDDNVVTNAKLAQVNWRKILGKTTTWVWNIDNYNVSTDLVIISATDNEVATTKAIKTWSASWTETFKNKNLTSWTNTFPTFNQNTTWTASNVTWIVAIANGWTWSSSKNFIDLTTAQSISWVKTFNSSPIIPAPTTDLQAATKKYVDDNTGWGDTFYSVATSIWLPNWSWTITLSHWLWKIPKFINFIWNYFFSATNSNSWEWNWVYNNIDGSNKCSYRKWTSNVSFSSSKIVVYWWVSAYVSNVTSSTYDLTYSNSEWFTRTFYSNVEFIW